MVGASVSASLLNQTHFVASKLFSPVGKFSFNTKL